MKIAICPGCNTQYDVSAHETGARVACQCGGAIVVAEARPTDARMIRCASCGASRGGDGPSCGFCGAVFSAVDKGWGAMCPKCFCRLPNDGRFCVECGLKIDPQKLSDTTELDCPRCAVSLKLTTLQNVRFHECGSCAGLWLNVSVFEQICKDRETQSVATKGLRTSRRATKFEIPANEQVKYIPCPVCKNLMNRQNFAHISGVVIDTCRDCGVWLDNQELNRIVRFVQDGGLERAREFDRSDRVHAEQLKKHKTQVSDLPELLSRPNRPTIQADPSVTRPHAMVGEMAAYVLAEIAKHLFY